VSKRILPFIIGITIASSVLSAQQSAPQPPQDPPAAAKAPDPATEDKRIFGIIPNYRTSPSLQNYVPLSSAEKFKIATQDSFDRGTVVLAAVFAGEGQLANSNRDFGQGALGYSRYLGTAYADFVIGDYMTEGVFPALFHQDPRYFRKGTGSGMSRLGYSMGQIFVTHGDSGKRQFNYSEVLGNSAAVAISNSYYANNRTASEAVSKLSIQLAVDMASNILKEFWPDLERKYGHHQGRH
jgi:hypothetical protein